MSLRAFLPAPIWPTTAKLGRGVVPALAGLAAPLIVLLAAEGPALAGRLVVLLIVAVAWQALFARIRGQGMGADGVVAAVVIALLVPGEAPLWQLLLAVTFGVVLAEQVFGGRGRNFVHPSVAALTFLVFSFTGQDYRAGPDIPVLALVPALVLMVASGQASWRILLSAALAMAAVAWAQGAADPLAGLSSGAVLLALVFLAADPVCSASTDPGRWAYGVLVGTLAALFSQAGAAFGAVIFAILLASIFAPLIDHCVVALNVRRRERRHHG